MANALYDAGRNAFLTGGINWTGDTIKITLVDAQDYTPNLAVHDFLDDIPAVGRVATSGPLTGKTASAGVADAADVTITAVSGDPFEYIIGFKDTGTASTSNLIFLIDTATGLPFTPSGGDIMIVWDDGSNKIFKL